MLTISLTRSWDWVDGDDESLRLTVNSERKNVTNPQTGAPVPNLIRGHMFHGPDNTTEIYRYGGTTFMGNTSFEGFIGTPDSSSYPMWSYDNNASDFKWDQHDIGQRWLPNHGAGADAVDHGLGFYLNGQIDMGTSVLTTGTIDQNRYIPLQGMLVIDLVDFSSRNLSTAQMRGDAPRVGGTMEYIAAVADEGILVALGGQIQPNVVGHQQADRYQGELVSNPTRCYEA
jgi:hypothetical protein